MRILFTTIFFGILSMMIYGQTGPVHPGEIKTAIYFDVSPQLSDLPPLTLEELEIMKEKALKKAKNKGLGDRVYPFAEDALPNGPDEVLQNDMGQTDGSKAPIVNFAGQSSPYFPPDCNGDVGPNHYFQTVNTTYAIYNKTGTQLVGPTAMNTLFSGVTGSGDNDGDPIVLYDEHADRWMAAEFSISGSNDYMLIAVSTSPDPTGTWYRWSFDVDDMPDYMKFGIQRDGYYMSTNTYNGLNNAYVFERDVMLTGGSSPTMVGFPNPWRPPGFHCIQPIDCDADFPPIGTPGQFITINDNAIGGGNDELRVFELDVNWSSPGSSTFNLVQQLSVSPFDSQFNAWGVGDITQPGTSQKLDAIPMILMYRAQYRNFGTSQNIVCMHTVDVDATNHAGIRWYELENTAGTWSVRQQGTYAPDAHSRWMGSIAMNAQHAIGIGYTVSSSSVYPSIRYCGQSPSVNATASGVLDIAEEVIQAGTTSQTAYNRWGDYSFMSVDPVDNNTFWYTSEYIGSSGSRLTRIAAFELSDAPLTADFYAGNTIVCDNGSVNFFDASLGSPTSWSWTFTGGTPSSYSGQNPPAITYNTPGIYNVSLTVGDGVGSDIETKTAYIEVQNIIADFAGVPTTVVVGNTVTFTDNSDCSPTSWTWSFPGGSPASFSGQNPPAVTYNTVGTYDVSLTVSNASGNDTKTVIDYITVMPPEFNMQNGSVTTCTGNFYDSGGLSGTYANNENFTMTFYPSTTGSMIRFNFTSFDVEYQSVCSYDKLSIYNGINTSAPLMGEYCGSASPGLITASNAAGAITFLFTSDVSVTNPGWVASISCYSSSNPPIANFSADDVSPSVGQTVNFTDLSSNTPTSWAWSYSPATVTYVGGTSSSSQNPQVQFNATGLYTVTLTAANAYGNDNEVKTNYINVYDCTVSNFPFTETFDNWTPSIPDFTCTADGSVPFSDCWTNVTGDNIDWDIFSGATGSTNTGPSGDHTGVGNYLYTETSSCYSSTGYVTSPVFDLTSLSTSTLTFWYHMYGASMGTLSVQVSTNGGSSWSANIWALSGDQGNSWQEATVSLTPYVSSANVIIRFTGLTGSSYTSDMAIDDVTVSGSSSGSAPVANFSADNTSPEVAQTVNFSDLSTNAPASWSWAFNPTTVTYVGGTNSFSQNPQVQFDVAGLYAVTLTATNSYGSDDEIKVDYINAVNPVPAIPPYFDDFESYSTGNYLAVQSPYWTTWTNLPGSSEDALIVTDQAYTGSQSVKVDGATDLILPLGDKTSGKYVVSLYIYVPSGYYGYYNLLQMFNGASSEWGMEVFLNTGGNGYGNAGGENSFSFSYNYNTWEYFENYIDLDNDLAEIWLNGTLIHQWQWSTGALGSSTLNQLGAMDMFAWNTNGTPLYYFDEVRYYEVVELNTTAFLEGPFNGTTMDTDLNTILPLAQPFNVSPWNYSGTENVGAIPNANIVEWVLIELRDAGSSGSAISGTTIDRQACFILSDGSIVAIDGSSNPLFKVPISQGLYVVVLQRNHIGIMSNNELTPSGSVYTFDFSSGLSQVYGGINGHKQLVPGVWGMFSGDGDRDGTVGNSDKSTLWGTQAGSKGYIYSDYNLDSESNNIDKDDYWVPNIGKGTQVPN